MDTLIVDGASFVFSSQLTVKDEYGVESKPDHTLRICTDDGETCAMWVEAKPPLTLDNISKEELGNSTILKLTMAVRRQITEQARGIIHTYPTVDTCICFLVVGTYFSAFEFKRSMFQRSGRTLFKSMPPLVPPPTGEDGTERKRTSRQRLREEAHGIDISTVVLEDWVYVHPNPLCYVEPMVDAKRRLSPVFLLALKKYVAPPEATFERSIFDLMPVATGFNEDHIVSGSSDGRGGYADGTPPA